jgi:hypothetical protein
MTIRKRVGSVVFTAAAAAAVVGMSIGPALASTHLTVRVSGGGSYTATAKTKTYLTDGHVKVTCNASEGSGKISNGTHRGTAPVSVGTVAKLKFSHCLGPLGGVTTKVHGTPVLSADSRTNSHGDTDAVITNVNVSVATGSCTFKVSGSAPGFYSNKTHELTMTPKGKGLTISDVNNECFGVVKNHDHPTYQATYKVSGHIKIESR